jgi:methionyl-tRNA formyltransferase
MRTGDDRAQTLRVVAFSVLPLAYQLIRTWTESQGHRIVLLVTSPGPSRDRSDAYRQVIADAPPEQDILVTTRPKELAANIVLCRPDLIVCANFPYLIPIDVVRTARLGGVNLHATPLPRYRGPNPPRMIYDANPIVGATLHRLDGAFDTGPILSVQERRLPEPIDTDGVWAAWTDALVAAFFKGMECCIRGEPGTAQGPGDESYAALFSNEERRLDWRLQSTTLAYRCVALNLFAPTASALVDGVARPVQSLRVLRAEGPEAPPGAVLSGGGHSAHVATGDGVVEVIFANAPSVARS